MSEAQRASVQLQFQDGTAISAWESFQLTDNYTDPLKSFSFRALPVAKQVIDYTQRLVKGALARIDINEAPQGVFLITTVRRTVSTDSGVAFDIECRTVLATPYEGHVDPDIAESFGGDTTVETVVLKALAPYGFQVVDGGITANVAALSGKALNGGDLTVDVQELKHKEIQANEGETAYGFASRIFSRLGFMLHVDIRGVLLLSKPDFSQPAVDLVGQSSNLQGGAPFFGEITVTDTNDGQYSEVVVRGSDKDKPGQKRAGRPTVRLKVAGLADPPVLPFADSPLVEIEPGRHSYTSTAGAVYKPFFRSDKHARDKEWAGTMARRVMSRQNEQAFVVEGVVDGLLSPSGRVWTTGTVLHVRIDKLLIDEDMWVLENTKMVSVGEGQSTKLKLIPLNSLELTPP